MAKPFSKIYHPFPPPADPNLYHTKGSLSQLPKASSLLERIIYWGFILIRSSGDASLLHFHALFHERVCRETSGSLQCSHDNLHNLHDQVRVGL